MLISRCNLNDFSNFSLKILGEKINRVTSFKYLGVILQENLKWSCHVDSLCKKIAGITCAMRRLGSRINQATKISMYYAMVNSHLSYLTPVWGTSITNADISRLQVAQNYAIRTVFNHEYYFLNMSSTDIMKHHNILNVLQIIQFNKLLMIHKIKNNLMKSVFCLNYTRNHAHITRSIGQPQYIPFRTNIGRDSIFRSCTECYFKLPPSIRNAQTIPKFKKLCKKLC